MKKHKKFLAYVLMGMYTFAAIIMLLLVSDFGWHFLFNIGCMLPSWFVPMLIKIYGAVFIVLSILLIFV